MRGRLLNIPAIARAAGLAAVAGAVIVAGIHFAHRTTSAYEQTHWTAPHNDTLAETLNRCEMLDNAPSTENRKACETAWADNRRRFFGGSPPSTATLLRAGDVQPVAKPEDR